MKTKLLSFFAFLTLLLPCLSAQTYFRSDADTSHFRRDAVYGDVDWTKTLPQKELENRKAMNAAYTEALSKKYGYRLLQLAAFEYDHTFTYGELNPNKMLQESYLIALAKKDLYLMYYLIEFDVEENFSFIVKSLYDRIKTLLSLGLKNKETNVLSMLANLADRRDFLRKDVYKEVQLKMLFIDNPSYLPYRNVYDYPDTDKPSDTSPLDWSDYNPLYVRVQSESRMNEACKQAETIHDGYRLLQLASLQGDHSFSNVYTEEKLFSLALATAQYNKDPYLLLYLYQFAKRKEKLQQIPPSIIFEQAYHAAVGRKDIGALSALRIALSGTIQGITRQTIKNQITALGRSKPVVMWSEVIEKNVVCIRQLGDTTVAIKGFVKPPVGSVILPTKIDYMTVTSIWNHAFSHCKDMTEITIPAGVRTMGEAVFEDCPSLKTIKLEGSNPAFKVVDGVLYSGDSKQLIHVPAQRQPATGFFSVPASVVSINPYAFQHCSTLSNVTLNAGLATIGRAAFNSCVNLTAVSFPSTLTTLDDSVFIGCINLSKVTFATGCKLDEIPDDAFHSCSITSINLPNSIKYIGNRAFYGCKLSKVDLPSTVKSIGAEAFYQNQLEMMCFPEMLEIVGGDALGKNPIKQLVSMAKKPFFMSVFKGCDTLTCNVYVPFQTKDVYTKSYGWKSFKLMEEATVVNHALYTLSEDKKKVFFLSLLYPGEKQGALPSTITVNGVVYPVVSIKP